MNNCCLLGRLCWFSTLARKSVCSTLCQLAAYGSKLYSARDSECYHAIYMTHRRYSNTPQGRQNIIWSLRDSVDLKSNFKWPQIVNISFLGENWDSVTVKRSSEFVAAQDRFGNTGASETIWLWGHQPTRVPKQSPFIHIYKVVLR